MCLIHPLATVMQGPRSKPLRIGAVTYLNSRPLIDDLSVLAPDAEVLYDVPSVLADQLSAGQLDVALIPSVEWFRQSHRTVAVSDACVACDGPVRSVRLFGRVPPEKIRTVALDVGSRTSAALVQILLRERWGLEPRWEQLPLGQSERDTSADAVLLIGDRGMSSQNGPVCFLWDLGEQWVSWTGLPFVFALWVATRDGPLDRLDDLLSNVRDRGMARLPELAAQYGPAAGTDPESALVYFRDHLRFRIEAPQRTALMWFYELACRHGLAPENSPLVFHRAVLAR